MRLEDRHLCHDGGISAPLRSRIYGTAPEMNVEQREEIRSEVEEELNLKIDEEGHLIDEPEKDAGTAEEPVDPETGMENRRE